MKRTLLTLCLILIAAVNLQAQETEAEKQKRAMELMSIKIDMTIDKELFEQVTPNTFVSEEPKAVIMAMVVPETYENAKGNLQKNLPPTFKVSDKGEKMMNGVKVLYFEGVANSEGTDINSTVYCMKRTEDTCIMVMGMLEVGADAKYEKAISDAANSVIKK